MTAREEILDAARRLSASSEDATFTIVEVLTLLHQDGTRYAESTLRTHITSRMCRNAADHHAVTYRDLERVVRGRYRLV